MTVNKIMKKKTGYYIAMYSAHASILENLIGENGKIVKLIVDAGGLRAPRGSYVNKAIFDDYSPVTNKTLHAKIIYLEKLRTLSLWTGNLRQHTLYEQENIVITKSISINNGKVVKKWFNATPQKEHLIIDISNNSISKIICTKKNIWNSFKDSINKMQFKDNENLSLYAFSPWGSSKFVRQTVSHLRSRLAKISLYTRPASEKEPLWIDTEIDMKKDDLKIERYVKKDGNPFPHYKCVFITRKDSKKEKIIWAYIGSANLTETAFFKKENIEFAAFFNEIRIGSDIYKIFNKLRKRRNWEERPCLKKQKKSFDESRQEYDEEEDYLDNFEVRRISRYLCEKLKTTKWQAKLEDSYRRGREIKLNKCSIKVITVLDSMLDLRITYNKIDFPLSIKRSANDQIYSPEDIRELIDQLLESPSLSAINDNGKKLERDVNNRTVINHPRNIRFPLEKLFFNRELITKKKDIIKKLFCSKGLPSGDEKNLVKMWAQILEEL